MSRPYWIDPQESKELETRFSYHSPIGDQPERYVRIRNEARNLADLICSKTPKCREQSIALTKLEEVVMWANAAIARRESKDETDSD